MKILVVDDTDAILLLMTKFVEALGHRAVTACNGREAVDQWRRERPDLILMDMLMPHMDGLTATRQIRGLANGQGVAIIALTANVFADDRERCVDAGMDDFIAKPFDQSVLMAKIQALLRRTYDFGASAPVLEHRGALLNTGDNTLTYQGQRVSLTKNEYRILLCLMQSKGRVVSREKLMERLWETDSFVDENTLTVNIGRLRKKLDAAGLPGFITTRVGLGYMVG